jgi:polyisoprenoid-binding protein YceI
LRRWIVGGIAVVAVVAFGGPIVHNHSTAVAVMLALPVGAGGARASTAAMTLDGVWHVGGSSIAGFRVTTSALGYEDVVIGRTDKVWGSLAIAGPAVARASFTVDVASIKTSDSARTLMDVGHYPTATFLLARPIPLAGASFEGAVQRYVATGSLTLHGTTRPVAITLAEKRLGSTLYVLADIPVRFADWTIAVPAGVASHGTLEVLLHLSHGSGATT